ncbi:MAG: serine/threonine-protein kinase, partial [Polyangiales bacterium]
MLVTLTRTSNPCIPSRLDARNSDSSVLVYARRAMGESEAAGHELTRWGTFVDPRVELTFLDANYASDAQRRLTRVVSSLLLWFVGIGLLLMLRPREMGSLLTPNLAVVGVYGVLAFLCRRPQRLPYSAGLLVANATSSLCIVYACGEVLQLSHMALGGLLISVFFGLSNPTVPVRLNALSVIPAIGLETKTLLHGVAAGGDGVASIFVLLSGFVVAVGLTTLSHRAARSAYAQERIIEAQRATIARQQELLKKELSHQVAERSRELGAVLAKTELTLDARRLAPGERFAERYKIVRALGAGGMGAVYEVERVTDGAHLALKAILGEVSGASAARFAREAEIGARVHHTHLVSIVDVGMSGVPYLVMELVRGESLEAQRAKFGDIEWALPILRHIGEGLAALHDAGVVHRDLKPANVLLADGIAKISDFGISRFGSIDDASIDPNANTLAATPKKSTQLTGTGVVMGTPLYMAPEAAKSARALDASA